MLSQSRSTIFQLFLIVIVLLSGHGVSANFPSPKSVQVSVRAKWPGTPLLLEAGELLSKEWEDFYWKFTEIWLHSEYTSANGDAPVTANSCIQKIVSYARSLLNEPLSSAFEFSLLLRSSSPKLVVYRQLAEESLSNFLLGENNVDFKSGNVALPKITTVENITSEGLLASMNIGARRGKCCWIDTGRELLFDISELQLWLGTLECVDLSADKQPEVYEFDHVYFESRIGSSVAILYGALGTDCFREFHIALLQASKKGRVAYIVRPVLPPGCETSAGECGAIGTQDALALGGYGVELALKNMEYKAMDDSAVKEGISMGDQNTEDLNQDVRGFIFSKILERKPELSTQIMTFREYLLSFNESETLDIWELKDLGYQSAQKIIQASDPLQSMQEISQNFPSLVSSLSRTKLNISVKDEITANQRMVMPGKSLMALNGALLNIEDIDLYMLLDVVHSELSLADQFSRLKIPEIYIKSLLSLLPPLESNSFRIDFRSDHVHYLNNLEKDVMYKRWRSNLHEILMPIFPGQFRYIRKNLFHAVYVLDPATACGLESIDTIMSLYESNFPIRFGVILYSSKLINVIEDNGGDLPGKLAENDADDDLSSLVISLFYYIKDNQGLRDAFLFLNSLIRLNKPLELHDHSLEEHEVEGAFVETLFASSAPHDLFLKIKSGETSNMMAKESSAFVYKLGLAKLRCCMLMNGLVSDTTEEGAVTAMNEEMQKIQEQVYFGHITSTTDVLEKLLSDNAYRRYNPQITGDTDKSSRIHLPTFLMEQNSAFNHVFYLHSPKTVDNMKPVTHLLFINAMSKEGLKLLHGGIQYLLHGSDRGRLGVIFDARNIDDKYLVLAKVFQVSAVERSVVSQNERALEFLIDVCQLFEGVSMHVLPNGDVSELIERICKLAEAKGLPAQMYRSALSKFSFDILKSQLGKLSHYFSRKLGRKAGASNVITNGRVIFVNTGVFLADDFRLLEEVEFARQVKHVAKIVEDVEWEGADPDNITCKFISDVIMLVSSLLSTRQRNPDKVHFEILNAKYSAILLNPGNYHIHIDATIDPISRAGQKLIPLLRLLEKYVHPSMRIVLNPMSSLADLPLKNYYRYVVPTIDDFSSIDSSAKGPKAFFANMPLSKTLTMNLDVPESWLVEPVVAVYDLDNILLEKLGETRTLQAVFELEALVLTGHCSEKDHDPPRGLQLILGLKHKPHLVDTVVMANLGYWQLKASPGVWYLQLAPGRSSELYSLKEADGGQQMSSSVRLVVDELRGKLVVVEVIRRDGKEHEHLLDDSVEVGDQLGKENGDLNSWNSNFFRWASNLIGSENAKRKQEISSNFRHPSRQGKQINIFSVASGHLYERFLKIMILSVLKNTRRPVKFWFIKNYLSPQFKDVIPYMAREYGFDYELITYKWPTWLHKQQEKQRVIWAYKILFLDVIFPISLEKVIFVDADQVVRTDMGELYDMDIKGRPLAYTPFCDNNKEMDGYRFWRQGFWKEHLRGRPYHISALYVVDLVRFRQTAAGDQLRVFYETLSKDPNSLANLDQDLPNYAQHSVPIFSLPQEWLWCESWCGNSTKSKAKTIDLCNNPMTKEPKLQGARRILPEWVHLDKEAREFTARILGKEAEIHEPASTSQSGASSAERLEDKAEL